MSQSSTGDRDARHQREAILEMLVDAMEELGRQLETADMDATDEAQLYLQQVHELGYLANQYRKLKRDTDLEEMAGEIELLRDDTDANGS